MRFAPYHPPSRSRLLKFRGVAASIVFAFSLSIAAPVAMAQSGTIDFTANQQLIEGFGFAEAFGEAANLQLQPAANQSKILDLLYSQQVGAGFSILRIGINTDSLIEPNSPGSPGATPTYVFDGSDRGQVWMAQQGQRYGVNTFYADAWSAPGFMKTNNQIDNGGTLCGVVGTSCATGDWRQAYANFLLQFIKFYGGVGVPIHNLGYINEPDLTEPTFASMVSTTDQALDFIKVLGPTIKSSGLPLRFLCCDGSKWSVQIPFTTAIVADPVASSFVDVISSHEYGSHATSPQPTTKPVWMSEWSSSNGTFDPRWDCGGCSGGPDGMFLANDVIEAFNVGNVNAYDYWRGSSSGAAALILTSANTGTFTVGGRFYAIAAISRFVRPGAVRVSSSNSNPNLNVVAFRNTDGSKVIAILNTSTTAIQTSFGVDATTVGSPAKTYLTDTNDQINETDTAAVAGQQLSVTLPQRSLTTIVLPPPSSPGTVQLVTSPALQLLGDGSYEATITISNTGTGTAQNVQMTSATLGSASGVPAPNTALPRVLGSIAPGGSLKAFINFPSSAGTPGSAAVERFNGTYNGGSFGGTTRTVLP
jgi:O-glycosyl hydrolase